MTEECQKEKEFLVDDENEIKWINIYKEELKKEQCLKKEQEGAYLSWSCKDYKDRIKQTNKIREDKYSKTR